MEWSASALLNDYRATVTLTVWATTGTGNGSVEYTQYTGTAQSRTEQRHLCICILYLLVVRRTGVEREPLLVDGELCTAHTRTQGLTGTGSGTGSACASGFTIS